MKKFYFVEEKQIGKMCGNLIKSLFICASFLLSTSCSNDLPVRDNFNQKDEVVVDSCQYIDIKDMMQEVSPEVADYYNNLKTVVYATGALTQDVKTRTVDTDEENQTEEENPIISKLESLVITDKDNGSQIGFYDLPIEQRSVFLDLLLAKEAEDLTKKTETANELSVLIENENEATQSILKAEGVSMEVVGQETGLRSIKAKLNSKKFFEERERLIWENLQAKSTNTQLNGLRVGWVGSGHHVPKETVKPETVRRYWSGYARRGDFLLALPVFENPNIDYNKNNEWGEVGHAGILCESVDYNTPFNEKVTLESYPPDDKKQLIVKKGNKEEGVRWYTINNWQTYHYLMGINRINYEWRWRGFKSGFYKVKKPVYPGSLADEALKCKGWKYADGATFFIPKLYVKFGGKRVTCTSFVWHCARKAYDINLSSWFSSMVTPADLYKSDNTYIRAKVINN